MRCAAVVLAAGSSSRLGQPKQLVQFEGETLLQRTIHLAQQAGASPILVVTGAAREAIEPRIAPPVCVVHNAAWQTGMASSIRAGLQALPSQVEAVMMLVCDQPTLYVEHLQALMQNATPQCIAASSYDDDVGVPAVFPRAFWPALQQLQGDQGARKLLRADSVYRIPLLDGGWDIDTPADLAKLQQATCSRPTEGER